MTQSSKWMHGSAAKWGGVQYVAIKELCVETQVFMAPFTAVQATTPWDRSRRGLKLTETLRRRVGRFQPSGLTFIFPRSSLSVPEITGRLCCAVLLQLPSLIAHTHAQINYGNWKLNSCTFQWVAIKHCKLNLGYLSSCPGSTQNVCENCWKLKTEPKILSFVRKSWIALISKDEISTIQDMKAICCKTRQTKNTFFNGALAVLLVFQIFTRCKERGEPSRGVLLRE